MPNTYSTISGDTWDIIALRTMGNESFTGNLINANPESVETVIFPAGITLRIPEIPAQEPSGNLPPWRR